MADTGKQSPLGQNVLGGILKNECLEINKNAAGWMGSSKNNDLYTPGKLVNETVLRLITWSINWGWETKGDRQGPVPVPDGRLLNSTYNNLIDIGNGVCPALGNAKPPTYVPIDPQGVWAGVAPAGSIGPDGFACKSIQYRDTQAAEFSADFAGPARPGPANAGYSIPGDVDQAQCATWYPYNTSNVNEEITKWGWIRCHALQAWCEFNHHGNAPLQLLPKYEDFTGSFLSADSFINSQNQVITAGENAEDFMEGTFSNMDDLITSDVSGINLAIKDFGTDLDNLGTLFDPRKLDKFGFPSTLLQLIYENGGIVQDLNIALGAAGLSAKEITTIANSSAEYISASQERKIYGAFLAIAGSNLRAILATMLNQPVEQRTVFNPSTPTATRFRTLADCLDVKRLFPTSYRSLTVPIYNTQLGLETGSKTYYLIYKNESVNASDLNSPAVKDNVGTLFTQGIPPVFDDLPDTPDAALPTGFDSYLGGPNVVVPAEIGLAAGALRYSMLQVNNITNLLPGEFGLCMSNLELMTDNVSTPPGDNQLSKPINEELHAEIPEKLAIGSGLAGTYTHSDFFGCMSGLPYPWTVIYNKINQTGASQPVERSRLNKIYEQTYLTVTWENAIYNIAVTSYFVNVLPSIPNPSNPNYQPDPDEPDYQPEAFLDAYNGNAPTFYHYTYREDDLYYIVGFQLLNNGGGYGRGFSKTDPNLIPNVEIYPNNCNASVTPIIGTNNSDASPYEPNGPPYVNTFGRISGQTYDTGTPYEWESSHITAPFVVNATDMVSETEYVILSLSLGPVVNATDMVPGTEYVILSLGTDDPTDFTLIGAPDNNLGTVFFATDSGTGDGTVAEDPTDFTLYGASSNIVGTIFIATSSGAGLGTVSREPTDADVIAYMAANCPQESTRTEAPPTGTYDAYFTEATNQNGLIYVTSIGGGTGAPGAALSGSGWGPPVTFWNDPGNSVTQNYIDQANIEIVEIASTTSGDYRGGVTELNLAWDILGRQLVVEQRARYIALTPVEIPRSPFVNSYETLSIFVDSMPSLAQNTKPHMSAQTIEMIVDRFCTTGQSAIAMMRQERNQIRLNDCGIPMNNNIPAIFDNDLLTALITNGTVDGATNGIPINGKEWTNPAWPYNPGPGLPASPIPSTRYRAGEVLEGTTVPGETFDPIIIDIQNPQIGPFITIGPFDPPGTPTGPETEAPSDGDPGDPDDGGGGDGDGGDGDGGPETLFPPLRPPIIQPPRVQLPGPNTTLPSVPSVDEAIEQVISCNCDCWDILGQ